MATLTINCDGDSGSFEKYGYVRLTYTTGLGTCTVTKIEGMRTDGYTSYADADKNIKIKIGSIEKNITLNGHIQFSANSDWYNMSMPSTTWDFPEGGTNLGVKVTPNGSYTGAAYYGKTFTTSNAINVDPAMTLTATVTNGSAVGSVNYSASASVTGQTISSYAWTIDGKTATNADGEERTMTGITANSNISWSVTATSSGGITKTVSGTLPTKHNAPTLSGGTWGSESRSGNVVSGNLSYNRTFNNGTAFGSHTLVYGTSTSYGTSATDPGSGTTWALTSLEPNKKYYWKVTETDNGLVAGTSTLTGNFTTSGNAPSIYSVSTSTSTNSATITWSESFDTNASLKSRSFRRKENGGEWTAWSSLSGRTAQPNNLKGYTKYYYEIKLVDNWDRETVYSSNFTTKSYVPRNIVLYGAEVGSNTLRLAWTYDAPAGDPVTKTEISKDGSSFVTITGTTYQFTNIIPDTDHTFIIRLTNNVGMAYSNTVLLTSVMGNLQMTANVTAPSFDQVQIRASATVVGTTKTLKYRFSNDNGVTWTAEQSSGNYTFTGLTEETTYNIVTEVRAIHTGTYSGDVYNYEYDTITTPADQARVRLKTNGSWVTGKAWIKINGVWKKAKKVYVKKNGEWVLNKNG